MAAPVVNSVRPVAPDKEDPILRGKTPRSKKKKNTQLTAQVVPGGADPNDPNQINVVDYAGQLVTDPTLGFTRDNPRTRKNESMFLSDHLQNMDVKKGLLSQRTQKRLNNGSNSNRYWQNPNQYGTDTVKGEDATTYDVENTFGDIAAQDMQAAQDQLSQGSQISDDEIAQHDMQGMATGINSDNTINYTGQALQKYATQNISNIVDTSTSAGKLLAQQLGEGNYTDSKATLQGQLELLQKQFVDEATGEPKIPIWASGTARNVSKIAAFSGMTGTAATAAMATAIMEASIPIAQQDAQFFQTVTLQNLTNKQQATINTANVLAKMEEQNVDNRMAAAIQSAKSFLEMDMANLNNEQQARVINNQNRVQAILEDAKQENAKRLFVAESQNEMNMFYDQLNTQIGQFNASQKLEASQFNRTLADSREKFYKEMNYNLAIANQKWRQTVQLVEDQQAHEASTQDVRNLVDLSVNQLNQLWDRSDALLDYAWKTSENEKDRQTKLAQIQLQGDIQGDAANQEAMGKLLGTFLGSDVGQSALSGIFGGLF